jgi:hypothetical protein
MVIVHEPPSGLVMLFVLQYGWTGIQPNGNVLVGMMVGRGVIDGIIRVAVGEAVGVSVLVGVGVAVGERVFVGVRVIVLAGDAVGVGVASRSPPPPPQAVSRRARHNTRIVRIKILYMNHSPTGYLISASCLRGIFRSNHNVSAGISISPYNHQWVSPPSWQEKGGA